MKTFLISAVIATLAGASASYATPLIDKPSTPQTATLRAAITPSQKANISNWHADAKPKEHHRNKFTG